LSFTSGLVWQLKRRNIAGLGMGTRLVLDEKRGDCGDWRGRWLKEDSGTREGEIDGGDGLAEIIREEESQQSIWSE